MVLYAREYTARNVGLLENLKTEKESGKIRIFYKKEERNEISKLRKKYKERKIGCLK